MKISHLLEYFRRQDGELIASFGQAQLIRHLNGRYELHGGTPDDHTTAREWISLFLHEANISRPCPSPVLPAGQIQVAP